MRAASGADGCCTTRYQSRHTARAAGRHRACIKGRPAASHPLTMSDTSSSGSAGHTHPSEAADGRDARPALQSSAAAAVADACGGGARLYRKRRNTRLLLARGSIAVSVLEESPRVGPPSSLATTRERLPTRLCAGRVSAPAVEAVSKADAIFSRRNLVARDKPPVRALRAAGRRTTEISNERGGSLCEIGRGQHVYRATGRRCRSRCRAPENGGDRSQKKREAKRRDQSARAQTGLGFPPRPDALFFGRLLPAQPAHGTSAQLFFLCGSHR